MKDLVKDFTVSTEIKIEWRDMDAAGHVHNVKYLGFVESGRVKYFEALGFDVAPKSGTGVVVAKIDCKYIFPVTYPDTVTIASRATNYGEHHITLETHLFSKKYNRIVAVSNQKMVFYDFENTQKMKMPNGFLEKMEALEGKKVTKIDTIKIQNSTTNDIDSIFELYDLATNYQKVKFPDNLWPQFDRQLIETEINENRQWKLLINGEIACVWATTFSDPKIWEERNIDPSVYIHRIATNPNFRGQNFVAKIVTWAKKYAKHNDKEFVRLDTCGDNQGLIKHYTKCGFEFLGMNKLKNSDGLPIHYVDAEVCFFEIKL